MLCSGTLRTITSNVLFFFDVLPYIAMPTRVMVRFIIEQSLLLACLVNNCLLLLKTRRHYFLVVARLLRVLWATSHWAIGAALDNKKYNFNMVSLEGAFAE